MGNLFAKFQTNEEAFKKLAVWYKEVEDSRIEAFGMGFYSVQAYYLTNLNYSIN